MKIVNKIILSLIPLAFPFACLAQVTITNPLGESDVRVIIGRVISGVLSVSGTLALLMFVYGGILWMTAMGKADQVEKGKNILIWSTLGVILIAGAYVLTQALFSAILTGSVS